VETPTGQAEPIRRRLSELVGQDILVVDAAKKTAGGWRNRYRLTELRANDEIVGRLGWRGGGSRSPVPAETAEGAWLIRHSRGPRLARAWSITDANDPTSAPVAELEKPQTSGIKLQSRTGLKLELKSVRGDDSSVSMRYRWELAPEGFPPLAHIDHPAKGMKDVRLVVRVEPSGPGEPDLAPILLLACTAALVMQAEDIFLLPS
jgi:hypothetical protein